MIDKSKAEALKAEGNAASTNGDYKKAVDLYSQAINLDPSNHVLYSNRSAAYAQLQQYEQALADAEKTISCKPDWPKGYSRKGLALRCLNQFDDAVLAYEEGLKLDPSNEAMKEGLIDAKVAQVIQSGAGPNPQRESARKEKSSPSPPKESSSSQSSSGHTGSSKNTDPQQGDEPMSDNQREALAEKKVGNEAYQKKQFTEALTHYEKAVELDPTEMTFLLNIAAVYFEMKQFEKCIETALKAVEVGRDNRADYKLVAKAFARAGKAYTELKDYEQAKMYYEKSLTEHRNPDTKTQLSRVEKLLKESQEAAYRDPEKAEEERLRGNELFKEGKYSEAVKAYTEGIKRNPDDAKIYSNRAACYTKLAAFDLGLKDCDKCLELDPNFIKGYIRKGTLLKAMQKYSQAMDAFQKAIELDENNSEAINGYRECMMALDSDPDQVKKRALSDPEVQNILSDPSMRLILEQMQNDPEAAKEHMQNPLVAGKIQKLLQSGLIAFR